MDKDKMIEDIIAMLDNGVKSGQGHINIKVDENQNIEKEVEEGTASCLMKNMPCCAPTEFFDEDEEK